MTPQQEAQEYAASKEAKDFAEWIIKGNYLPDVDKQYWLSDFPIESFTTEQLFEIYKNRL